MNRTVYDHCKANNLNAQESLNYALDNGGVRGDYSNVKCNESFHTKITFSDGSDMFFGDDAYTVSITK